MLTHLRWLVPDVAACAAFYADALGLARVVDVPGIYAEFDTGGARLALYRADLMGAVTGAAPPQQGDAAVACFRVPDVEAAFARATAAGAIVVAPPHDQAAWVQRVAHHRDPAGHLVELWSPLAPKG